MQQSTHLSPYPTLPTPRVSKTGDTVQNRNIAQKKYFCIFEFRSIKYKKPDPVYRPGPDRERKKTQKPAVPGRDLKPWPYHNGNKYLNFIKYRKKQQNLCKKILV